MYVYAGGTESGTRPLVAQGPKSDALKFERPICQSCNSAVTQRPDRAYHDLISAIEAGGGGAAGLQRLDPALSDPENYHAVCRYFGKLLGNHLADMEAPIPIRLCEFVGGMTQENCVYVAVRDDPRGGELRSGFDGVAIITVLPDLLPVRVQTSRTVGNSQFLFGFEFSDVEIETLKGAYPEFVATCREAAQAAQSASAPDPLLTRLGLDRADSV